MCAGFHFTSPSVSFHFSAQNFHCLHPRTFSNARDIFAGLNLLFRTHLCSLKDFFFVRSFKNGLVCTSFLIPFCVSVYLLPTLVLPPLIPSHIGYISAYKSQSNGYRERAKKYIKKTPFTLHLTTDEEKWPKCDMSNAWNLKYAINGENKKNIIMVPIQRGKVELKTFFMVISWIWGLGSLSCTTYMGK